MHKYIYIYMYILIIPYQTCYSAAVSALPPFWHAGDFNNFLSKLSTTNTTKRECSCSNVAHAIVVAVYVKIYIHMHMYIYVRACACLCVSVRTQFPPKSFRLLATMQSLTFVVSLPKFCQQTLQCLCTKS